MVPSETTKSILHPTTNPKDKMNEKVNEGNDEERQNLSSQNPLQNGGFDTLYQAAKTILENEHTKGLGPLNARNYGLIDIWDSDDHSEFYIDAPGLKKEDIKITLEDNRVIVKATRNNDCEPDEVSIYSERYQNVIERNIMLPALCDVNTISSTYKDGVIIIKVGRIKVNGEKNVKKIPVS